MARDEGPIASDMDPGKAQHHSGWQLDRGGKLQPHLLQARLNLCHFEPSCRRFRKFYSSRIVANIPPVRRSSSGAVVRKMWRGEPAAAQTGSSAIRSSSISTNGGGEWPTRGTPPVAETR